MQFILNLFRPRIKVVNDSHFDLPVYKTRGAAAMDLKADLLIGQPKSYSGVIPERKVVNLLLSGDDEYFIEVMPFERVLVNTGIKVALPRNWEAQIRPRSGLAVKEGLTVVNSPGTIDSDYRGYIYVGLINLSDKPIKVFHGQRIAQIVFSKVRRGKWKVVNTLGVTARNIGGFGSTGKF